MSHSCSHRTVAHVPAWTIRSLAPTLALFCLVGHCLGQGTVTIGFEGPPPQPLATYSIISEYSESGMLFFVPAPDSLLLVGSGLAGDPDDGTTYLGTSLNTTLAVSSLSGVPFSLNSFDVAEFAGLFTPPTLQVVGFLQNGTTVTNDFTGIGTSFQTVHLDSGFADLNTVDLTGGFAFDNMVVVIPEPSVGGLILLGGLCGLGYARARRRRQMAAVSLDMWTSPWQPATMYVDDVVVTPSP